jgi:hypothetical protein
MDEFETTVRNGLDHLAQTMRVSRPPLGELLLERPPAHRPGRSRYVLAGAGIAVCMAAVSGVALWRDTADGDDDKGLVASSGCAPRTVTDGVVGAGELSDGRAWDVRVEGAPPYVRTTSRIDGEQLGASWSDQLSWAPLVNRGMLGWSLEVFAQGQLVEGAVPTSTATVEVRLADGEAVYLCPAVVPGIDAVSYVAGYLPSLADVVEIAALDAEGRRLASADVGGLRESSTGMSDQQEEDGSGEYGLGFPLEVDPELVQLPLGGQEWPEVTSEELTEVLAGELPSGPWSLRAGGDETVTSFELTLPEPAYFPFVSGSPEQLLGDLSWGIEWIDDRYFVAGLTPADVAAVAVVLDDGQTIEIATVEPGAPGFHGHLFASALPVGAAPTAMAGQAGDGTTLVEAVDVRGSLEDARDPAVSVGVPVRPVDQAR